MSRSIWRWFFLQLQALLSLLYSALLGGLLRALLQKRFSYGSFFGRFLTLLCWSALSFWAWLFLSQQPEGLAWGWLLFSCFIGGVGFLGYLASRLSSSFAFYENYLLILLVLALAFAIGQQPLRGYQDLWLATSFAEHYFGPLWSRLLCLSVLLLAVVLCIGSSLGFLAGSRLPGQKQSFYPMWIARRYMLGSQEHPISLIAVVAVLGVAIGVASLVVVNAVMSGYQEDIRQKLLATHAHMVLQKYGADLSEYPRLLQEAKTIQGIVEGSPFLFSEAMLSTGQKALGVLLKGIEPSSAQKTSSVALQLQSGQKQLQQANKDLDVELFRIDDLQPGSPRDLQQHMSAEERLPGIMVGYKLFERLQLHLGQKVLLTTPSSAFIGRSSGGPKRLMVQVVGVFSSGMHEYDRRMIYTHLQTAQRFLDAPDNVHGIDFVLSDPREVSRIAKQLLQKIGRYPYHIRDWRDLNSGILTALSLQKVVMFLVLSFMVVVASFNIAATLFMAVVEKNRDIAILKAMGATDADVIKIFVAEGLSIGCMGTFLGIFLGIFLSFCLGQLKIGIAADVYMIETLGVELRLQELILVALSAIAIAHLATLFPAFQAAKQHPVETMRYQ